MGMFTKYQWLNSCTGIEIHILPDGSLSGRYCMVTTGKDSLDIIEKGLLDENLLSVSSKLPGRRVALTLTGKGVLVKKITEDNAGGSLQLNNLFPNLKAEDFYVQHFVSGSNIFISIIRRELVDDILLKLQKHGVEILLVSVGPFSASHILRQLNFYGGEAVFDGHQISSNKEHEWEEYKYVKGAQTGFPLKIGIEVVSEQLVLAYAAAFQLALYPRLDAVSLPVDRIEEQLVDFEQKQKFNFRGAVILSAFFLLLLVNFIAFTHFNSLNESLLSQVNHSASSVESMQKTENEIKVKENLIKELGWAKGINYAWICDQLGQSVPAGLKLKQLAVNPVNGTETNRQRREVFDTGKLMISGDAGEISEVNDWILRLKSVSWIKQVNLESFSPSADDEKQSFIISIKY